MAKIRPLATIQEKWTTVTPQRSAQYQSGVETPLEDWQTQAKASEGNFEQGIQKAIAAKSFGKGVAAAGTDRWQSKTLQVGVPRWAPGVAAASNDYGQRFAPFRDVIERTALPPRFPRGDARNYARVAAIGDALNKKKIAG